MAGVAMHCLTDARPPGYREGLADRWRRRRVHSMGLRSAPGRTAVARLLEVGEQAGDDRAVAGQLEVADARVVVEAKPVAGHLAPDADGVVGDVFLVVVARQREVLRGALIDNLSASQVRERDPGLGRDPGAGFDGHV